MIGCAGNICVPYYVKDLLTQVLMHFFIHENTQDGKGDRGLFVRQDYVTELMFLCLDRPKLIIYIQMQYYIKQN